MRWTGVYNSELFARHFSEELYVHPHRVGRSHRRAVRKNFVHYNFNAIEADVLGTVYEQYLGSMVAEPMEDPAAANADAALLAPRKRADRGRAPPKRKSQGIYYTPAFITKYIVQQTVGRYLDENGYNPSPPPRILDMACGSGSFLIEAFDVLDGFVARQRGQAYGEKEGLDDSLRRLELLNNLHLRGGQGKQAVDVARLNLLLRALHWREKLPMLTNIHHADSLRPETWEYFKTMQAGGFDIIIGNPPYVRQETLGAEVKEFGNISRRTRVSQTCTSTSSSRRKATQGRRLVWHDRLQQVDALQLR